LKVKSCYRFCWNSKCSKSCA